MASEPLHSTETRLCGDLETRPDGLEAAPSIGLAEFCFMALSPSSAAVERTLAPLGFVRHERTWCRDRGDVTEVIDLQLSPTDGEITLNLGLFDPEVHELVWGEPHPPFTDEPQCCLRYRAASLVVPDSGWWKPRAPETPAILQRVLVAHVLPALARVTTRRQILEELEIQGLPRKGGGIQKCEYAALNHLEG